MPIESKKQQGFMFSHENDKGKLGKVARDFIAATPKSSYKSLPEVKKRESKKSQKDHMKDVMS